MNGLAENKKFITTAELKDMGYSYYRIGSLEKDGLIRRVNRSTYEKTLPDWSEIKIFYFAPTRMDLGVTEVRDGDNVFHISMIIGILGCFPMDMSDYRAEKNDLET